MEIKFATNKDFDNLCLYDNHISKKEIKNCITQNKIIVCYENNNFLGYLRYGLFWDNIPFMNLIFCTKKNQGIGTALCNFWENEMKRQNYDMVMTSTLSSETSQHFYRKLGYLDCGSLLLPSEPLEIIFYKKL